MIEEIKNKIEKIASRKGNFVYNVGEVKYCEANPREEIYNLLSNVLSNIAFPKLSEWSCNSLS